MWHPAADSQVFEESETSVSCLTTCTACTPQMVNQSTLEICRVGPGNTTEAFTDEDYHHDGWKCPPCALAKMVQPGMQKTAAISSRTFAATRFNPDAAGDILFIWIPVGICIAVEKNCCLQILLRFLAKFQPSRVYPKNLVANQKQDTDESCVKSSH